jgi:hypothetical protein
MTRSVGHMAFKVAVVCTYISRPVLPWMFNKEGRYRPSRHPLAHDTDWEEVRDAEKGNDVGMSETLPRHNFVPE